MDDKNANEEPTGSDSNEGQDITQNIEFPAITGSLCIVHIPTGHVAHKFRKGNKDDQQMWTAARDHKETYFPIPDYGIEDRTFSTAAAAGEKSGFYVKVKFEGQTEPIVIGHRFLSETKAKEEMESKYAGQPGVEEASVVPASETLI